MHILKVIFVIMLCVPVAYIAYILIDQLLDLARQTSGPSGSRKGSKRSRTRSGKTSSRRR